MTFLRVELPDELAAALEQVASELGSTAEALLQDAAKDLVVDQMDRLARIRKGIADIEAGRFVEHDQVVAWLRSWGTETSCRRPKAASDLVATGLGRS